MINLKDILKKYFDRNKKYLLSDNVVHEMNGVVLYRSQNQIFDFHSSLIEEIKAYCKDNGFEQVDKIIFLSSYDIDIHETPAIKLKMEGHSRIKIIKEHGDTIVLVCICESVNIKERWQEYV